MSRIERLVNLTSALLHTRRALSADDIFEMVPGYPEDRASFRRQFERDKDALRQLGLPLVVETPTGQDASVVPGYRIRADDYFMRDPGLTKDELSALHLAAQTVRYGNDSAASGLWKLGLAVSPAVSERIAIESGAALPADEPLAALFDSIAQRRSVTYTYKGEARHVAGRRLAFRNGHWYFTAFDRNRNEDRSFRVDRMDGPIVLADEDGFELPAIVGDGPSDDRPNVFDFPWELGDAAPIVATVEIDQPQSRWALARLGPTAVVEESDSATVFRLHVRNIDAFRSFVLGFLHHAEVLSPPELRTELLDWLEAGRQ